MKKTAQKDGGGFATFIDCKFTYLTTAVQGHLNQHNPALLLAAGFELYQGNAQVQQTFQNK